MELIAAALVAGPCGFFARTSRAGLIGYLIAWAIVFPIQTVVVNSENPDDINWSYFALNGLILAAGIGLNRLGAARGRSSSLRASVAGRTRGTGRR
jgi:hypothetical protein